jgi:hypothetical protein
MAQPTHETQRPEPRSAPPASLSWPVAARALAVSVGPSVLLDLLVGGSIAAVVSGWLARPHQRRLPRALRPLVALGAAFPAIYLLTLRPWHRRWGATGAETRLPLPGDERVPEPGYEHTRAVTVAAPAEAVWPWLAQIGQGRGGFYSYDWLENLAGCDIHSADRVHPEWQDPRPGDTLAVLAGWGPKLAAVEPGRALVIEHWGTYAVRPLDARSSRLIAHARQPRGWPALLYALTLEIPHFVMERRMLLGIKARAERAAGDRIVLDEVLPTYHYGGTVTTVIQAPPAAIFRALREVTLGEMPLAYALGAIRYLPGRLTGRTQRRPDELSRPFSEVAAWLVLAEQPDRELVVGGIGKLHDLLDQQFVSLDSPAAFAAFSQPDYEKFVQGFRIAGGNATSGYTLVAEHRTQVLGPSARWKFALYWYLLVGWSGNLLLRMLLQAVKRRAEREAGTGWASTHPPAEK